MKRSTFLSLPPSLPLALATIGCGSAESPLDAGSADALNRGNTPNANPAICYLGESRSNRGILLGYTIGVIDADGSDARNLYTTGTNAQTWATPTWSANGGSISFIEEAMVSGAYVNFIKALDVGVVNGVATASNVRTLLTKTDKDLIRQAWSPSTTAAEIAFVQERREGAPAQFTEWSSIRTVSMTGAETVIHAAQTGHAIRGIAWNPAGTKIAFHDVEIGATGETNSIRILDRATGTVERTLVSGSYAGILGLDWSRGGDSLVYFAHTTTGSQMTMYTLALAEGANPRSYSTVTGVEPSFSPNNGKVVSRGSSRIQLYDFATGVTSSLLTGTNQYPRLPNWKR